MTQCGRALDSAVSSKLLYSFQNNWKCILFVIELPHVDALSWEALHGAGRELDLALHSGLGSSTHFPAVCCWVSLSWTLSSLFESHKRVVMILTFSI